MSASYSRPTVLSFSQVSSLYVVPRTRKENFREIWYTKDDNDIFKQDFVRDVRRISSVLAYTTSRDMLNQEVLQECVGIEVFLLQEQRLVQAKKRAHIMAVVNGQHECSSPQELAFISEKSSRWARVDAQNRAKYLNLL